LAAASDTPVSFVGEIGTGKKVLAQTLHFASERRRGNLAILDCRQSTSEQLRRELVGPAVISVEGVIKTDPVEFGGLLHPSQSGTLVLSGVGRLAVDLQELLVREIKDDSPRWRLVATERETLESCLADGRLIESFYYLLTRFVIAVPPLRERSAELADHCQWILARRQPTTAKGEPVAGISPEAMRVLESYDWPGNLVELEAVLLTAARRAAKPILSVRDLPQRLSKPVEREELSVETPQLPALDAMLESIEQRMVELALRLFKGNKSKAAEALGISRPRLHKRAGQIGRATLKPDERRQDEMPAD
jgi:DNA-binding NtrC family response regulator